MCRDEEDKLQWFGVLGFAKFWNWESTHSLFESFHMIHTQVRVLRQTGVTE